MSWEEDGCCWDYRSTNPHFESYASYYSDCGVHISSPQAITHATTCYIICPGGERDCQGHFGFLFWMLMAFFAVMICSIIASVCSKCKQRREARAAVQRNMQNGGLRNNPHRNSVIEGQAVVDGADLH